MIPYEPLADIVLKASFTNRQDWSRAINGWADTAEQIRKSVGSKRDEKSKARRAYALQFRDDAEALLAWLDYGDAVPQKHGLKDAAGHIAGLISGTQADVGGE